MADWRKLIEPDDKKSHRAKNEGWNIMLKKTGGTESRDHICFYDDPHHIVLGSANGGSESAAYLEYHQDRL